MIIDKDNPSQNADQWSFQSLFELIGEAVSLHEIVYDDMGKAVDFNIIDVNPMFEKMLGVKRESAIGEKASGLFGTEEAPYLDVCARVAETGESESFESYFPPIDRYLSINVFSPGSGLFAMVFSDITEKKTAEEALRESVEKYRTIYDNAQIGMYRSRFSDGKMLSVNRRMAEMFGYESPEECVADYVASEHYVDPGVREQLLNKMISDKRFTNFEAHITRCDGSKFWAQYSGMLFPEKGYFEGVAADITQRKMAERELRESEERFRQVAESAEEWIWEVDANALYTYASPVVEKLLGYKPEEIVGKKHSYDLFHPDDIEPLKKSTLELFAEKKPLFRFLNRNIHKNGNTVWLSTSGLPITDDNGNLLGYRGADTDITEQKQAEEKLRASEERFRNLSNLTFEGILIHYKGVAIDVNESLMEMFGYSREDIIGKNIIKECVPEEYHSMIAGQIVKQVAGPYEVMARKKDGTLFPIEIEARNVEENDQTFRVTAIRDITERKKAEKKLKLLSQAVESSVDGLAMGDLEGRITYVNKAFAGMFGYPREELIGIEISSIYPDDQQHKLKRAIIETVKGRWSGELVARRKNGERFPIAVSASIVTDDEGKTIAHIASHRDITDRKNAEREKAEMQSRLFQSEKLETIGILAGGIAHDFNNILTPIIGYTDMVLSRLSSHDPITEDLEEILSGAHRAKDLVKQILTFSQQMEMEKKPIRLQQVIEEALRLLRPIIPSTIEILKEIDVNCPMVMADSSQMHEVIVNLCTNAYQAMADGGGQITIELKSFHSDYDGDSRYHPILQEGEYARLTVSDAGPGMTEEIKDHIFEPFFTTKKSGTGSGLGLSVVHGIIQSHGGEITVFSEPGKGVAFHVYLPVTKEVVKPHRKQMESFPSGHESILLVDDEISVLELLVKVLNHLGYSVDAKSSSVDALEAFRKHPDEYDLILTDLTMPKMTGLDLADEIRKTHPELPVILLTGYGNTISEDILKKKVSTVIGKPIDIRRLAGILRDVLDSL